MALYDFFRTFFCDRRSEIDHRSKILVMWRYIFVDANKYVSLARQYVGYSQAGTPRTLSSTTSVEFGLKQAGGGYIRRVVETQVSIGF